MSLIPNRVPLELQDLQRWVLWRYETRDGKSTKVPITAMGYAANVTNPNCWSEFGDLVELLRKRPGFADGIGFVFTPEDCFSGLDLDHVWLSDADLGASWAMGILKRFADTYQEASPSDTGIKIWCRARAPRCGRWPIGAGAIEVYDRGRFFTVTGRSNGIKVIRDHQADVEALVGHLDGDRQHTQSQIVPDVIPQGQRHPTLVSLAGTMFRRGMAPEAIEAALLEVDRRQCDPPHGAAHIRKIVASMRGWAR
jgi:primase-polymerase (primpol)-like protein